MERTRTKRKERGKLRFPKYCLFHSVAVPATKPSPVNSFRFHGASCFTKCLAGLELTKNRLCRKRERVRVHPAGAMPGGQRRDFRRHRGDGPEVRALRQRHPRMLQTAAAEEERRHRRPRQRPESRLREQPRGGADSRHADSVIQLWAPRFYLLQFT